MRLFDVDALESYLEKRLTNQPELFGWLCARIADISTIEAVPVRYGRWVKQPGLDSCPECGAIRPYQAQADVIEYWPCNYCPNCGMKLEEDDD